MNSACDHNRLCRLLNGQLSPLDEAEVARHLEACSTCQQDLRMAAGTEQWWLEIESFLRRPHHEATDSAVHAKSWVTSLLHASDNPAMLGRVGEFDVLEVIGVGGMSVVFKGYDQQLNRWVAIKVLGPQYAANAAARKRFEREAQAAAAVVHPHVVGIHAVHANHQPPYFVMTFVPGETLQQRLDRVGPLSVSDVLRIGQQIAEGLAAAHEQGVVHRDIKPANILLEGNVDRVLLTDFGLALVAAEASLTQSGLVLGTPQYMSPEQSGCGAVDHRSDLFSLGSVLYALLAGHPPFRAERSLAVLRRVTDDQARPLREINPSVPDWLAALIERLHAKNPTERFQTAREVAGLLKQCLAHVEQPTVAPLPQIDGHGPTSRPRSVLSQPLRWIVPSVVFAALASVITLLAKSPSRSQLAKSDISPAPANRLPTTSLNETTPELIPVNEARAADVALTDVELAKLDLSGDWKLTFPSGIDDTVRFLGRGRNRWLMLSSTHLAGMYRRERDRLVIDVPQTRGLTEFVWKIESPKQLILEHAPRPPKVPVDNTGATLVRQPATAQQAP